MKSQGFGRTAWLHRLSLRAALAAGFMAVIALTLAVGLVAMSAQNRSIQAVDSLINVDGQFADLSGKSNIAMLKARRAEKDFLQFKNDFGFEEARSRYVTLLRTNLAEVRQNMVDLRKLTDKPDVIHLAQAVELAVGQYEAGFLNVVDLYGRRGHVNTGVESAFRGKAHEIEAILGAVKHDRLMVDLLNLRRNEKDFIARGEDKYGTEFVKTSDRFKADLAGASLPPMLKETLGLLVDEYRRLFEQYVQIGTAIDAEQAVYLAAAHAVEPLLEKLDVNAVMAKTATQHAAESESQVAIWVIMGVVLLASLLGMTVAYVISRSIASSVDESLAFAKRVAGGDLATRLTPKGQGEFRTLAAALNRMTEALGEREAGLRRAQHVAKLSHVITAPDGSFESWPDTLPALVGIDASHMPRSTREWLDHLHPDDRPNFRASVIEAGRKGIRTEVSYRLRRADQSWIHIRQVIEPLQGQADTQGKMRWFNTVQDVTEQRQSDDDLRRFRAAMDSSGDGIVLIDRASMRYIDVNQTLCTMVGYPRGELLRMTPMDLFGIDREVLAHSYDAVIADNNSSENRAEGQYRRKDGLVVPIETRRRALLTDNGWIIVATARDITERKEAETKINRLNRVYAMLSSVNAAIVRVQNREELFREACRIVVEAGQLALAYVCVVDVAEQRLKPAASAGADAGFLEELKARLMLGDNAPAGYGPAAMAVREKRAVVVNDVASDSRIRHKSSHVERGIRSLAILPLFVGGQPAAVLGMHSTEAGFFDEVEMKLLRELAGDLSFALEHICKAEKLDYLVYYDALTGLANRGLFHERLDQFLGTGGREGRKVAVIVIDIERFRSINETFGRQAGDELLKQFAERARRCMIDAKWLARIGGDQFASMIPDMATSSDVVRRIEQRLVEVLGAPFSLGDTEVRISVKIGIALFPDDGPDADMLLRNAEAALKKAKASGERYLFYAQEMTARVAENLALENRLRQALEKDEFVLHYQPKVDIETRRIVGVEALIRWQSPELGLVPPMKFIPLMEETGLILPVGTWALKRASLDHRGWVDQGLKAPRIAVNVSPIQLRQHDFVAVVERAIMEGLAPTGIDLEITESLVMEDVQGNIEKLKSVRGLGIRIAIDDFGTGYSSLGYLAKLPIQTLKIDRSFIIVMLKDSDTMTLVSTIISLAHSLRLKVVAEGVELEEQAKVLRLLRCDEMQGYLFSKPLPLEGITALLRKLQLEENGNSFRIA